MSRFHSDCSQCCGLCCIVPAYFALQGFAVDKPAHTPCAHLDCKNRCAIHDTRDDLGFTACTGFDCYGAGQWVTQVLHRGTSWSDSPTAAARLFRSYQACLPLFRLAATLDAAMPLAKPSLRSALRATRDALLDHCGSEVLLGKSSDIGRLRREARELLAQFRRRLPTKPAGSGSP